jgi:hypothetical protein
MDARKREIARIGKERERESEREIARVRERERERERERKWEREGKRKREKSPPPPPPPDNGVPIWERDPQACCRIIAPKMHTCPIPDRILAVIAASPPSDLRF